MCGIFNKSENERMKTIQRWGILKAIAEHECMVEIQQTAACQSCQAFQICQVNSESRKKTIKVPKPDFELAVGQKVRVEETISQSFKAVWLAYALPLCLMILALFIGVKWGNEIIGAVSALAVLVIYYPLLRLFRKRIDNKFSFRLVQTETQKF